MNKKKLYRCIKKVSFYFSSFLFSTAIFAGPKNFDAKGEAEFFEDRQNLSRYEKLRQLYEEEGHLPKNVKSGTFAGRCFFVEEPDSYFCGGLSIRKGFHPLDAPGGLVFDAFEVDDKYCKPVGNTGGYDLKESIELDAFYGKINFKEYTSIESHYSVVSKIQKLRQRENYLISEIFTREKELYAVCYFRQDETR